MFSDFFSRDTSLKIFGSKDNWFFKNIRCGILHQGETRDGWRILRTGPLLNINSKVINATLFFRELRKVIEAYENQIIIDDECWKNFKQKMKAVCKNCSQNREWSN
jgi:hypothetical protein